MAVSVITDWTGDDLGENPTLATEPAFTSVGGIAGNCTYVPAIGGEVGQAVRVSGARDFVYSTSGNHWRVGFRVARVTGTQSSGHAVIIFRTSATNRADVFLRNQNGGQYALRQGSGGTTYAGQSSTATQNGEDPWRIEVEYESDGDSSHTITVYLFEPDNDTSIPDDVFAGVTAGPVDNFRIVNPTGSTGLTLDFGAVLFEPTGAPIWTGAEIPGTLDFLSNVYAEQTELVLVGKTTGAEEVTLDIDGRLVAVEPDEAGYFRVHVDELGADTAYPWDLLVDGVSRRTGETKTLPNLLDGLTILWGSCFDAPSSAFFSLAAARNPDLIVNLGDWGYQYITGGPNGNTSPTDVATVRAHREGVLAAEGPQGLFTAFPTSYTYSDCDGAGANADGTTGGHATGAVQAAYRQQFAHPTLPLEDCGARSWVVGRVRFIQTDETALASVRDATDDESKTKLGATQEAWLFDQIDQAKAAGQAIVWFGDGPWIEPTGAGSATYNSWAKYNTARTRIGAYIEASGVPLARPHGDTHTVFADDGSNNDWGGFPTASAAPFHTTAQPFGYPTSEGSWPTSTTNSSRQYGIAEFADDGETITLTLKGYSSTNAAPTEVERYEMVIDLTPGVPPVADYVFIEYDGDAETVLEAVEWDGLEEASLTVVESG